MKIAIVGAGTSGSYLASRLSGEHHVVCYEMMPKDKFEAVCAWGTSKGGISRFVKKCGLDFDDYILHEGRTMHIQFRDLSMDAQLTGLCTYNKLSLLRDLLDGHDVHFGQRITEIPFGEEWDLVIDSTGFTRSLLPRIENETSIPAVLLKVKYKEPPFEDFYIQIFESLTGYLWFFPLSNGYAHLGAGDYYQNHIAEVNKFLKLHPCEVVKRYGRSVRIKPPSMCSPIFNGKVVGVGEAIGTVHPLLGEGTIPSLQCAELLAENLHDLEQYRENVLRNFRIYETAYALIKSKLKGDFTVQSQLPKLRSIFSHMKKNWARYGFHVNMHTILKLFNH